MEAVRLVAAHARAADRAGLARRAGLGDAWRLLLRARAPARHFRIGESLLVERAGHELACGQRHVHAGFGDRDQGGTTTAATIQRWPWRFSARRDAGHGGLRGHGTGVYRVAADDLKAAEQIPDGLEELERLGDRAYYATVPGAGRTYCQRRGQYDEAASWCLVIRETTGPGDVVNVLASMRWRDTCGARGRPRRRRAAGSPCC